MIGSRIIHTQDRVYLRCQLTHRLVDQHRIGQAEPHKRVVGLSVQLRKCLQVAVVALLCDHVRLITPDQRQPLQSLEQQHAGQLLTRALVIVVNLAIGFLTPPVGVNLFVASGVAQAKIEKIAVAVLPMIALMLIVLAIITYCPSVPLMLVH